MPCLGEGTQAFKEASRNNVIKESTWAGRLASPERTSCAVRSTRGKSHTEGLDQPFNSLDAQRSACKHYIASQASDGGSRSTIATTTLASPVARFHPASAVTKKRRAQTDRTVALAKSTSIVIHSFMRRPRELAKVSRAIRPVLPI